MRKGQKKPTLKCNTVSYCNTLQSVSSDIGKPGINIITYVNMMSGKTTLVLAAYRRTTRDLPPLALNFCPFCGFDFSKRKDWRGDK